MNRRQFMRSMAMAGLFYGAGGSLLRSKARGQDALPVNDRPVLLNITLRGGPDFRHLIAPAFNSDSSSYGHLYWSNRWQSHGLSNSPGAWERRWNEDFLQLEAGGHNLGIWSGAAWLKEQFDAGNVAIINNVAASTTRDHSHSVLIYESGDRNTGPNDLARDGWGGRLATAVGGSVVSMTNHVRLFCYGPHPENPSFHDNSRVITAGDTRDIALFEPDELIEDPASRGSRSVMSRALSSYYAAKGEELSEDSPYYAVIRHERAFRDFGERVEGRLSSVPVPEAIEALYDGTNELNATSFGRQMRNVYDSFACSDIFDFRVGSLVYDGFDSHRDQRESIEPKFEDLFGAGRGLATLYAELERAMPDAAANTVTVIGGEFGRQLTANGDQGTDHGRGNTILVIGQPVRGGVYGALFPDDELPRYEQPSADIDGKTSLERVFASLCDWVEPWASPLVYPDLEGTEVEDGVDLGTLFG